MNLYEGIFVRKSVRSFLMEPVEQKLLGNIMNFANHLEMLSPEQKVRYEIVNNLESRLNPAKKLLGEKVPYYFLVYGKKTDDYLINAGYVLEQIVLYMTAKGLGTCYLGLKKFKSTDDLEPVIAVAFGKPKKNFYEEENTKAHRKALGELCCFKTVVSEEIKEIMGAARLAPSSMNSQPWRFVVYENRVHLFCRKEAAAPAAIRRLHLIDMGIVLAHLAVAAEEFWYSPEITKLTNISELKFKQHEYIISILLP